MSSPTLITSGSSPSVTFFIFMDAFLPLNPGSPFSPFSERTVTCGTGVIECSLITSITLGFFDYYIEF